MHRVQHLSWLMLLIAVLIPLPVTLSRANIFVRRVGYST